MTFRSNFQRESTDKYIANKDKRLAIIVFAVILIVVILAIIFGPLITIFAVNALFSTGWAYSLTNWFAVFWIKMLLATWFGAFRVKFS